MNIELLFLVIGILLITLIYMYIQKQNAFKKIQTLQSAISQQTPLDIPITIEKEETLILPSETEVLLREEVEKLRTMVEETKLIAQDATMIKSDILTNIRHEIRTPMNSILVFSEMIAKESADESIRSYSENIFSSGHLLLSFLNHVIELSEMDSGRFEITMGAVDVKSFIDSILVLHQNKAEKKNLLLSYEIHEDIPESIVIDAKRVKDILDNLLDNAIKFTDTGEVKFFIFLNSFDESKHEAKIVFRVQDSGVGISKINQKKLFNIFESKEIHTKPEERGTGLGLSINKKSAKLMNGDIEVDSDIAEGATFSLTLNSVEVLLTHKVHDIDESSIDFSIMRAGSVVVVIDEMQNTLDTVSKSFKGSKVEVLTFTSPRDAIGILQTKEIDLIVIDVNILSEDDGAVAKILKKITKASIVSLVTNRLKSIAFPKDGVQPLIHLKKPLRSIDLFRASLKVLNSQDILIENGEILEVDSKSGLCFETNKQDSQAYFTSQEPEIESLLEEALINNNLKTIEEFAKLINKRANLHDVKGLKVFTKELLAKIDFFDIAGIDTMMREYSKKAKLFQNKKS